MSDYRYATLTAETMMRLSHHKGWSPIPTAAGYKFHVGELVARAWMSGVGVFRDGRLVAELATWELLAEADLATFYAREDRVMMEARIDGMLRKRHHGGEMYMHVETGTVQRWTDWVDGIGDWIEWDGTEAECTADILAQADSLVRVRKNRKGEYVEV